MSNTTTNKNAQELPLATGYLAANRGIIINGAPNTFSYYRDALLIYNKQNDHTYSLAITVNGDISTYGTLTANGNVVLNSSDTQTTTINGKLDPLC